MNPIIRADVTGTLPGSMEKPSKDKQKLKKACQDFEAILVGKLMKESMAGARKISKGSGAEDSRPFGPLEDLTVEMVAEEICESGGVGLWKMLYDQVSKQNGVNGDSGNK